MLRSITRLDIALLNFSQALLAVIGNHVDGAQVVSVPILFWLFVIHVLSKFPDAGSVILPFFFFELKTGLQKQVRSPPPPKNPIVGWSHLLDLSKNPGLGWSHLLDPPKNPGLGWSHLWSPGRPGPETGTVPGGLTCGKLQKVLYEELPGTGKIVLPHSDENKASNACGWEQ